MAASEAHLAYDLGASSGRAIVGHITSNKLQVNEIHRFKNVPNEASGRLHWNIPHLLSEVRAGLRKATSSHPEIATVGVDSWGVDFGLLDMSGNLVTAPYCYRDAGVDGMMEAVFDRILRPDIYARTGTQFLAFNSLYRLLSIAIESPEHLARAHKLLMIADLVHHELTGNPVCEFTNATTSQFYNPALDGWDTELLRDLDIPTHFLPDIVRPGSDLGLLLPDVAADTGALNLHVVAPATHDTGSAVAAVPFESADAGTGAYISCGTWALVGCERTEPLISDAALHHNFTNEGGAFGTWRFLKNVAGLWLLEECRRVWARNTLDQTMALFCRRQNRLSRSAR